MDDTEFCSLQSKTGRCDAYFERFYFDINAGNCRKFVYGGCDGNGNNFKTMPECEKRCGGTADQSPVKPRN